MVSRTLADELKKGSSSPFRRRYDARRPLELKYPTTQPLEEILDDVKVPVTGEVIVEVSPNEKETIKLLHAPPRFVLQHIGMK